MKVVTAQELESDINDILEGESEGITPDCLIERLSIRYGDAWLAKKQESFKFTNEDINAVANSRYYKKSGLKLLMGWGIIILALFQLMQWFPVIPYQYYYAAMCISIVVFMYMYAKGQRKNRKELWSLIGSGSSNGGDTE